MNSLPLVSPEDQKVTFVELFFDLVFVFSITQIVGLLHGHLDWMTIAPAILVFWLVWWAWTQFTWALNASNTDHPSVQFITLLATAVAFFMAVGVPNAFQNGVLWFALSYIAVRLIGLLLYKWVAAADKKQHTAVRKFMLLSLMGLAAVLAGGITGGTLQYWLWTLAIVLDIIAAAAAGQMEGWNLHPAHFAERHGLIVIIALGESLIVAAAGLTHASQTFTLIGVGILAVTISCALWWSYFPYARPMLEKELHAREGAAQSCLARDIYSLAHFPMLCGIIGFAVVIEMAIAHPEEPLSLNVRSMLAAGLLLFLGGTAVAIWRAAGRILFMRLLLLIIGIAVILIANEVTPYVSFGIAFVMIVSIVALEHRSFRSENT